MVAFVGRQGELAALRARFVRALAGEPQIVQVSGPAGIGKTALIEHFLLQPVNPPTPGQQAPVVLRASGEETERLLSYGVIDQIAATAGAASRDRPGADERQGFSTRGSVTLDDPVTVGTRLLALLDGLGGSPVVLVVDDIQWADRPSLQALTFVLRRLDADQVLTIVAARDDLLDDVPESLQRLIRGPGGTALAVRGLLEDDLRELAEEMGITGVSSAAAGRLRYSTQGNPLHARAILTEFEPSQWGDQDRPVPAPRSFRRLVEDRYAACGADARSLIDAAAILDPLCRLPEAAALGAVTDSVPAVDDAVRNGLLEVSHTSTPWTLSFPHPLVRAAVQDAIGPGRRHALHTAAAVLTTDEAAALRHRVAAAALPDEALAAELTAFADREAARQAWQSAAAHLVSASRLSTDPKHAQRRVLRAVVWMMLRGDAATATGYRRDILSFPQSPLRDATLGSLATAADDAPTARDLLGRAWAACDRGTDPETTATVALMTAIHWYGRLDAAATVSWCERTIAALSADPGALSSIYSVAVTYLLHGLGYAGRTNESVAAAASAADLPGDADQLWLNPRSARGVLRMVDDDLPGARADLASVAEVASRKGILNTAAFSFAYLARTEWLSGAWDDAVVHAERAVAINIESDFGFLHTAVAGIAVLVPAARGDWTEADAHLRAMEARAGAYERSVVALSMSRARVAEARGDPSGVLAALEPVHRFAQRDAVDEPGFWAWQDLYADALVGMHRADEAAQFLVRHEKLAEQRGRRSSVARLARARGAVEAAVGDAAVAQATFARALEVIEGLDLPFERARIELAAGRVLRRAGRRRAAADLLEAARGGFTALGAAPYADRCVTELAAAGLAPTSRTRRDRARLTSQELVVARLAAGGSSNREIADQLVVSVKTVEYHLRNAFAKFGISSRRQLPERLSRLDSDSA